MGGRVKRRLLGAGVIIAASLWVVAHITGWIHSLDAVNELSWAAIVLSLGAWWDAEGAKLAAEEGEASDEAA